MLYRLLYGAMFIMFIISIGVSVVDLKVRSIEHNIRSLNKQYRDNYQELQSIKAEWNYLNNPKYLRPLVNKYLPNLVANSRKKTSVLKIEQIPLKN